LRSTVFKLKQKIMSTYGDTLTGIDEKQTTAAKVVVLSVFILARSSTMSYAYEKGIGNPSGQQRYKLRSSWYSYRPSK
jgi:hypothetical protein